MAEILQPGEVDGLARLFETPLAQDLEFLTARARAIGTRNANKLFSKLGLNVRSYAVLSLACSGANPSQRELAEFLSLGTSQIVTLIDELETAGVVERVTDPRDRRSNVIVATEQGQKTYVLAEKAARDAQELSLKNLSVSDREALRRLLAEIAFDN